jgi:hypothetical protein
MTMGTWLVEIRIGSFGMWWIGAILFLVKFATSPTFVLSTLFH